MKRTRLDVEMIAIQSRNQDRNACVSQQFFPYHALQYWTWLRYATDTYSIIIFRSRFKPTLHYCVRSNKLNALSSCPKTVVIICDDLMLSVRLLWCLCTRSSHTCCVRCSFYDDVVVVVVAVKKQKHDMTHVEVWAGDGPKTIGARWHRGKVQVFDSYRFEARSYHTPTYHFKSIDTWLKGICQRSVSEIAPMSFLQSCIALHACAGGTGVRSFSFWCESVTAILCRASFNWGTRSRRNCRLLSREFRADMQQFLLMSTNHEQSRISCFVEEWNAGGQNYFQWTSVYATIFFWGRHWNLFKNEISIPGI